MLICGLKLTHDGAIALIENNKLIFSIELEKILNNKRFTAIQENIIIKDILSSYNYKIEDIDHFVIDGWGGTDQDALAIQPRLEIGNEYNLLKVWNKSLEYKIKIAHYQETKKDQNINKEYKFDGLLIDNKSLNYSSFLHVAGHIYSAYCTSPFSKNNESSYILVWDGGMYPCLYYFNADSNNVESLGPIFLLIGNIYTIFSQFFGPFKVNGNFAKDNLSVAGKVMAYISLGQVREELFDIFNGIYRSEYNMPMGFANIFSNKFKAKINGSKYSDEDILMSFHSFLENMLIDKLIKKVSRDGKRSGNLCLAGGCALNIKWNSAIRNSYFFNSLYIPPFPNDSGSAIGIAACLMSKMNVSNHLNWNVYSGPKINKNEPEYGWIKKECSEKELAKLIFVTKEPIVILNGNAELGPRALGNRSILADPTSPKIKDILNQIKIREYYRPVSPICMEEYAQEIFDPGTKDPYMLFDHMVRPEYINKIPGIIHLDNSARLQTVNKTENEVIYNIINEYYKLSGIPLLCNTSANYKGSGFFPDVNSVTKWGKTNFVWCEGTLFEKKEKNRF